MGAELQGAGGYRAGDADRNPDHRSAQGGPRRRLPHPGGDRRATRRRPGRPHRGELDRLVADLPPEWRAGQEQGQRPAGRPRQRSALRRRLPGWYRWW